MTQGRAWSGAAVRSSLPRPTGRPRTGAGEAIAPPDKNRLAAGPDRERAVGSDAARVMATQGDLGARPLAARRARGLVGSVRRLPERERVAGRIHADLG